MNLDELGLTIDEQGRVARRLKDIVAATPKQCEHVKASGEFCGSPALRGRKYCFFHLTHIGRQLRAERARERASQLGQPERAVLELPALEDADSIQIALMQVIDAILNERLDAKRGGLVLYGLQTASSNLRHGAQFRAGAGATVAGRYEEFEADYELGDEVPELKAEEPEEKESPHPSQAMARVGHTAASEREKSCAMERTAGPLRQAQGRPSAPAEAVGRDDTVMKEEDLPSGPKDGLEGSTRAPGEGFVPLAALTGPAAPAEGAASAEQPSGPPSPREKSHSTPKDGVEWDTRSREDTQSQDGIECGTRPAWPTMDHSYTLPGGGEEDADEGLDDADAKVDGVQRFCDPPNYLLCTIFGPLAQRQGWGTESRLIAREVSSQRVGRRNWTAVAREEEKATQVAA